MFTLKRLSEQARKTRQRQSQNWKKKTAVVDKPARKRQFDAVTLRDIVGARVVTGTVPMPSLSEASGGGVESTPQPVLLGGETVRAPMLARPCRDPRTELGAALAASEHWYEEKFDGQRLLLDLTDGGNGDTKAYTRTLKRVAAYRGPVPRLRPPYTQALLDGELVHCDEQGRIVPTCDTGERSALTERYIVFDVQAANGRSMLDRPWRERRRLLEALVEPSEFARLSVARPCSSLEQLMRAFASVVDERDGEGLMVKRADEPYEPNERRWWKLKPLHVRERRDEYELYAHRLLPDRNGQENILECGYYYYYCCDHPRAREEKRERRFRLVCRVSSGMNARTRNQLRMLLATFDEEATSAVVVTLYADRVTRQARSLRHPVLARLRLDLDEAPVDSRLIQPGDKLCSPPVRSRIGRAMHL